MDRTLLRLGFILILMALLTGFAMPTFVNARLGLTAHIVGVLGGMMLLLIGLVSSALVLEPHAMRLFRWCWIYATYANWIASVLGAATGASAFTPLAGAGTTGRRWRSTPSPFSCFPSRLPRSSVRCLPSRD
jgi:(hydroxyamino)benzene mutase